MAKNGIRVLVAEDCPTNQLVIKLMLQKLDSTVELASDGVEAVEMATQNDYDLILMDMQMPMPNMNGYEATARIKAIKNDIPIVAVTAHAMVGDREKCLAAGCNDYITKPVMKETLAEIIEMYCCNRS